MNKLVFVHNGKELASISNEFVTPVIPQKDSFVRIEGIPYIVNETVYEVNPSEVKVTIYLESQSDNQIKIRRGGLIKC